MTARGARLLVALAGCASSACSSAPPPGPAPGPSAQAARPAAPPELGPLPAFERRARCAATCVGLVPSEVAPPADVVAPVWLWAEELAPGARWTIPERRDATFTALVLSGSVLVDGADALGKLGVIQQLGAGLELSSPSGATLVAAVSYPRTPAPTLPPNAPRPRLRAELGADQATWGGGAFTAFFGLGDRAGLGAFAPSSSLGLLSMRPLAAQPGPVRVPAHVHAAEWEALVILRGSGTMRLGAEGAERVEAVAAGRFVTIPAGVRHAFEASEPVLAVQLYTPPGPEQRFRKLR